MKENIVLEFDDALDVMYTRHDGGDDPPKGVISVKDFHDLDQIGDIDSAALAVSLDIFRGLPVGEKFANAKRPEGMAGMMFQYPDPDYYVFSGDSLLAKSAFDRMLARAKGIPSKQWLKIARVDEPLTFAEAFDMVARLTANIRLDQFPYEPQSLLNRVMAIDLIITAMKSSDGTGELPYLYYVPESTSLTHLKLPKNTAVASPDCTLVTLTVDGVFYPLVGGWEYSGDLKLTLTQRYELYRYVGKRGMPGMPGESGEPELVPVYWNDWTEPYRAALFLEDGKKVPHRSVDSAVIEGSDGRIHITSCDEPSNAYGVNDFNGIIVGSGKADIENVDIRFEGNSRDDFQGMGAGILLVGDDTEVTIDNTTISNHGTVRSAFVVGGNAKALVKNSRFSTRDGVFEDGWVGGWASDKMRTAPNCGGFEGNCRATNLLDTGTTTYFNSQIMAEKWGVLSTDNNHGVKCCVINSFVGITGGLNEKVDTSSEAAARSSLQELPFGELYSLLGREEGLNTSADHPGGYGNYSIGPTYVKYAGSTVVSADYNAVCAADNARVIYCASTPENLQGEYGAEDLPAEVKNTVVYCAKTGVQLHRGGGNGGVIMKDNTLFHCGCMCFAIKSCGATNVIVDNSTLISEMGVILQLMDEDDVHGADGCVDHTRPTEAEKANARDLIETGAINVFEAEFGRDSFARFSNMTVNGDSYNSSGYTGSITREELEKVKGMPWAVGLSEYHSHNARNLDFTLENVVYNGVISTGEGFHMDRDTGDPLHRVPEELWYNISVLRSEPKPVYQAGLILHMKNGSVWNPPRTCYLSSLDIDSDSVIHGKVFLNGQPVIPEPGVVYKGFITVQPGK